MVNKVFAVFLFPFSLIYGFVVGARNLLYDAELLKSAKFNLPVISVGNLSIGGAGKTPHVEYIVELLGNYLDLATLSRGYKRKTKGFLLVHRGHNALLVGDEPLQFKRKYPKLTVAVSESRAMGIPQILSKHPEVQAVLLDDAFQHRSVTPGFNILLSSYDRPFYKDYLLPSGRLREWRSAYERADTIIITKCPHVISVEEVEEIKESIELKPHQSLYFSYYEYYNPYSFFDNRNRINLNHDINICFISAIANTAYLRQYLEEVADEIQFMEYEDHHIFTEAEIDYIIKVYKAIENPKKIVLTTEKDAMRLDLFFKKLKEAGVHIYILPIKVRFHLEGKNEFDAEIKDFLLNFKV